MISSVFMFICQNVFWNFYLKEELQFKKNGAVLINCVCLDKQKSSALF